MSFYLVEGFFIRYDSSEFAARYGYDDDRCLAYDYIDGDANGVVLYEN